MIVDLRSDTVTLPSKDMLEFMMSSNVGDDVYGEDPTVNLLQSKVAAIFGKEVGMFFPSGTMANQTAIKLHTNPGEQVICDKYSHIYNYEGGGASFNSGVSFKLINGERGMFTSEQAANSILIYSQLPFLSLIPSTRTQFQKCLVHHIHILYATLQVYHALPICLVCQASLLFCCSHGY